MSLSPTVARTPTLRVAVAAPLSCCSPAHRRGAAQQHDPPQTHARRTRYRRRRRPAPHPHRRDRSTQARRPRRTRGRRPPSSTAKVYRDRRAGTLVDALGYAPGVFVQPRFGADEARISIRGSGLQRTFHGRGLVVLQDGSPINLADGASTCRRSNRCPRATSACIAVRTHWSTARRRWAARSISSRPPATMRRPSRCARKAARSTYRRAQVAAAGTSARADGYASLTGMSQDGYRDHAVQETYRLFANAGFASTTRSTARLYFTKVDTRSQLPGNLTFAEFQRDPSLAAPATSRWTSAATSCSNASPGKLAWSPDADDQLDVVAVRRRQAPASSDLPGARTGFARCRRRPALAARVGLGGHAGDADRRRARDQRHRCTTIASSTSAGDRRRAARTRSTSMRATASPIVEQQVGLDARWIAVARRAGPARGAALGRQVRHRRARREFRHDLLRRQPEARRALRSRRPCAGVRERQPQPGAAEFRRTHRRARRHPGRHAGSDDARGRHARAACAHGGWTPRCIARTSTANCSRSTTPTATRAARSMPIARVHQGIELGGARDWTPRWRTSVQLSVQRFPLRRRSGLRRQRARRRAAPASARGTAVVAGRSVPRRARAGMERRDVDRPRQYACRRAGRDRVEPARGRRGRCAWRWFADLRNVFDKRWIASTNVVANAGGLDGRHVLPGDGRGVYAGIELRL